jgi:acyl-CoA thioester hydrolase
MNQEPAGQPVAPITSTDVVIRVGYADCDPQSVAHHSVYPVWLEIARTELLRRQGVAYRDLEAQGVLFVVARMSLRYRRPARYDDLIRVEVTVARSAGVKVEHGYRVWRGEELLCTAETTLVCLDRAGNLRPVPQFMC